MCQFGGDCKADDLDSETDLAMSMVEGEKPLSGENVPSPYYDIQGSDNHIFIRRNGGEYVELPCHECIPGLWISIHGNSNTVRVGEDTSFENASIGIQNDGVTLEFGSNVRFAGAISCAYGEKQSLRIGDHTIIHHIDIILDAVSSVLIGSNCLFAPGIQVRPTDGHSILRHSTGELLNDVRYPIEIGDGCWIGLESILLKKTRLAAHTIVGARSLLCGRFYEEYTALAGSPARIVARDVDWSIHNSYYWKKKNQGMQNKKLKILVAYHKPATLLKNDILEPIHLGRILGRSESKDGTMSEADFQWLQEHMIGDDTGENISEKNRLYNELTAIYWAWKNYEALGNPDYLGLCQYRRMLDCSQAPYREIGFQYYDEQLLVDFVKNLNYENLPEGYDLFINEAQDVWIDGKTGPITLEEQYAHYYHIDELTTVCDIIREQYPDFAPTLDQTLKQTRAYFFNQYIMKKEVFFAFCEWTFPIIEEFLRRWSFDGLGHAKARLFIGERLLNFFLAFYQWQHGPLKIREYPILYFIPVDRDLVERSEKEKKYYPVMRFLSHLLPAVRKRFQEMKYRKWLRTHLQDEAENIQQKIAANQRSSS